MFALMGVSRPIYQLMMLSCVGPIQKIESATTAVDGVSTDVVSLTGLYVDNAFKAFKCSYLTSGSYLYKQSPSHNKARCHWFKI